jgi:lipopolysaccharide/colanic/teichoic acid biosynthesis glycosyltransferase
VAIVAGIVLLPVLLVVALVMAIALGRPVFFRQQRSGLHGNEFSILKFRTMRPENYAGESDADRSTRLGALLRMLSLDELPQLWNVLKGDMSIIGPRPTLPEQVVHYNTRQRGRLAVRPGLTGWAQVKGRNSISWPERIELDLWYIQHRSLALDTKIIGLTIARLLRPHGITGDGGVNPGFPVPSQSELQPQPLQPRRCSSLRGTAGRSPRRREVTVRSPRQPRRRRGEPAASIRSRPELRP